MKKKYTYFLLVILVFLVGCTTDKIVEEKIQDNSITVTGPDSEIIERSETLSDVIVDLYGIDDATTIIFNDTAIIGLKVAYDEELDENISDIVKNAVLIEDPNINQVLLTDKDRVFNEINSVVNELLQGKSYDTLVEDINKIKNKIK